MKYDLLEEVFIFLLREGFTVKSLKGSCFDVIARKGSTVMLIKALEDANAINSEHINEMNKIASYIDTTPVIVAEKAGTKLEDNVVYSRLGIYTLNPATFKSAVTNKALFIKRTQAGLTASILGNKLKKVRERKNLSLNDLAKKIGVSKRMISKYENEGAEITVNKAAKVYDLFGDSVFKKVNLLEAKEHEIAEPGTIIGKKYSNLGFKASDIKKGPFDIIAKKEKDIILTDVGDKTHKEFISTSKLLDAKNLVIFKRKRPKDIPAMTKEEFMEFEKSNELIKFLKEF
ncbi:helix-turn-helix domain-containing protein [Candidatus Woesearchaeota archaeon]|nr:helix-turn-helix domain-containing protein [Candidatus Woesearchaeota archaeon]